MRRICYRLSRERYDPNRHGVQRAQRGDAVQLRLKQGRRTGTPAERRLGDEEVEPLAVTEERRLTIQAGPENLRDLLLQIRRLEHGEHPAGVFRGLQEPRDHRGLEGQDLPRAPLQVLDVALDVRSIPKHAAPVVDLGIGGLCQCGQQAGHVGRGPGSRSPRCYFRDRQERRAGFDARDLGLADPDPLRQLTTGKAAQFTCASKLGPEALPLPRLRPRASVWSNHVVISHPLTDSGHHESFSVLFVMIRDDSFWCVSTADPAPPRQASFADRAKRMLPAAALWLLTLTAMYVVLRRSGVYGVVGDAQNLIAIFGVLHAIAYAIRARHAIGRRAVSRKLAKRRRMGAPGRNGIRPCSPVAQVGARGQRDRCSGPTSLRRSNRFTSRQAHPLVRQGRPRTGSRADHIAGFGIRTTTCVTITTWAAYACIRRYGG